MNVSGFLNNNYNNGYINYTNYINNISSTKLSIDDNAIFNGDVEIKGNLTITGNLSINGEIIKSNIYTSCYSGNIYTTSNNYIGNNISTNYDQYNINITCNNYIGNNISTYYGNIYINKYDVSENNENINEARNKSSDNMINLKKIKPIKKKQINFKKSFVSI
jgi:hypothetical protein